MWWLYRTALTLGQPLAILNSYIRCIGCIFDTALYPNTVSEYPCAIIAGMDPWYWRLVTTFRAVIFVNICG
jgi:hypothetical protein